MAKDDTSWRKSFARAGDYLLAVLAGNLLLSATAKPEQLFELEGSVGTVLVFVLTISARYRRGFSRKLVKATVVGVRWIIATFAGTIFGIVYTIVALE